MSLGLRAVHLLPLLALLAGCAGFPQPADLAAVPGVPPAPAAGANTTPPATPVPPAATTPAALAAAAATAPPIAASAGPATEGQATKDAATRASPVVAGRPARVFVFAGLGEKCETLAAPEITVDVPPGKGDLTFTPGQETTIQYTAQGTCVGKKAVGTGIYYTARAGATGTDKFKITAKLASGQAATRTFEVRIEQ